MKHVFKTTLYFRNLVFDRTLFWNDKIITGYECDEIKFLKRIFPNAIGKKRTKFQHFFMLQRQWTVASKYYVSM